VRRVELVRDVLGILGLLVIVGWIVGNDRGVGKVLFAVGWICAGLGAVVGLALWRYERRGDRSAG
jgi:hypothetical protein